MLPQQRPPKTSSITREISGLASGQLWLAVALAVVGFSGMFALYAYISPVMTDVAGFSVSALPVVLVGLYGIGMVAGTFLGGWAADRSLLGTITVALAVLFVSLSLFAAKAHILPLAVLFMVLVGMSGTALSPALQTHLVNCAPQAPQLSSALNHSAFNMANAFGAWAGGTVISMGWGFRAPSLTGAAAALAGLIIAGLVIRSATRALRRPAAPEATSGQLLEATHT